MSSFGTRPVAALLGLGAAAYTAWVLEVVLATGLDPIRTYVSELAAEDQPLGGLFRATDFTAGLLVFAGALLALVRWAQGLRESDAPRAPQEAGARGKAGAPGKAGATEEGGRRPWVLAGWVGLLLFGAATAADAWLPLSCAPTVDPVCAARETAGLVPATHRAHAISSTLAMTGALTGVVALTVAARRYGRWAPLARTGPFLVALELAATAWTLAAVGAFTAGRGTWSLGAGQRLQVLLVAVWLGVLAYSVFKERRT
ncbi:DUF998 domain-containing protein [Streptomyces sp. NPDC093225]|uniref:DUF998 domain-containing protein n=1 Tax=Streptomyces sp. NPDC093225 TaxID=3366034 RepID=UPI00382EEDD0